jgi:hypothetical protein
VPRQVEATPPTSPTTALAARPRKTASARTKTTGLSSSTAWKPGRSREEGERPPPRHARPATSSTCSAPFLGDVQIDGVCWLVGVIRLPHSGQMGNFSFAHQGLPSRLQSKPCAVSYANVQGCWVPRLSPSSATNSSIFGGLLFWSDEPAPWSCPWPEVDNDSKKARSMENAQTVGLYSPRCDNGSRGGRGGRYSRFDRGTSAQQSGDGQVHPNISRPQDVVDSRIDQAVRIPTFILGHWVFGRWVFRRRFFLELWVFGRR